MLCPAQCHEVLTETAQDDAILICDAMRCAVVGKKEILQSEGPGMA